MKRNACHDTLVQTLGNTTATMHFSVACVARGLTVTEPTTPASFLRVVTARLCDAVEVWVPVETRVRSYKLSKTPMTVTFCFKVGSGRMNVGSEFCHGSENSTGEKQYVGKKNGRRGSQATTENGSRGVNDEENQGQGQNRRANQ